MQQLWNKIESYLQSQPAIRQPTKYYSMMEGLLPYRVGYQCNASSQQRLPSLLLEMESSAEEVTWLTTRHTNHFPIDSCMLWQEGEPNEVRLIEHCIGRMLEKFSRRVLQNNNQQLEKIEEEIVSMVEDERVDIKRFSQNCLTNASTYDYTGNLISINSISIPADSKKYTEAELLDNVPHQVRIKKRKRINNEVLTKKSQREVLQQFEILSKLFSVEEGQGDEDILEAISLATPSYNDLWDSILEKMDLNTITAVKTPTNLNVEDENLTHTINKMMEEAIQYEQATLDEEEEPQQQQQQQQQLQEQTMQTQKSSTNAKQKSGFESVKIERKAQMIVDPKYQFAVQDESDLSNFYDILPKDQFATSFHFELDDFQKRSILHLERKESVFVAAHTSAGKTVVAEYGIGLAIKHKRKVIYTSPIKALSNQKYRELGKKFPGLVGIVTGDVSLNQSATCVIMTTEILRNSLYKGAEMIRDIEWVIFDEVHYINNPERGVVWQETIIMLPQHIGIIMLSATVPNYMSFANWVGRTKRRVIYVMKTFHRPVPLQHSLFIFNKFHVIKEANGRFLTQEYRNLKNQIIEAQLSHDAKKDALKEDKKKKLEQLGFYNDNRREQRLKLMNKNAVDKFIKKIQKSDLETAEGKEESRLLETLIADCQKKELLPCVVFIFSKKKINALAQKIYFNTLTSRTEQFRIMTTISSALSNLKPEDRDIQQFRFLSQICRNGYAVHHGDLLPLAKEIVQLLFSEGLIKVLLATETFAMGINMPTKTVIFNQIEKVAGSDGNKRYLNSSEYVQMSGRAGRRGLDEKGTVIVMVKNHHSLPQTDQMVKMIDYPGEQLVSKFKITYQIILNLYTSKDIGVKDMMRQSFLENPKFSELKDNMAKVQNLKKRFNQLSQIECPFNKLGTRSLIDEYLEYSQQIRNANFEIFQAIISSKKKMVFPKFGKLLGHNNQQQLCIILQINYERRQIGMNRYVQILMVKEIGTELYLNKQQMEEDEKKKGINRSKRVILEYDKINEEKSQTAAVPDTKNQYHYYVYYVSPHQILHIYHHQFKNISTKQIQFKREDYQILSRQLINPPKELKLAELPQIKAAGVKNSILDQYENVPCHNCELKEKHRLQFNNKNKVKSEMLKAAKKIDTNSLGLIGHFDGMLKLLKLFNFIHNDTLTLKGRVAREIDIYVTEIIVEAVLDPLDHCEVAALLSAFVCDYRPRPPKGQERVLSPFNNKDIYTTNLQIAIDKSYKIIQGIAESEIREECYINAHTDQEMIFSMINFHLCDCVYKWAIGMDFVEAKMDTEAPEGTIVRTIMRLSMLMSKIKTICKLLGSSELEDKIDKANEAIKRDIIFCQSLYLAG